MAAPAQYSTSRLHYHLNLKGPLGLQVIVQKLDEDPWQGIPACIRSAGATLCVGSGERSAEVAVAIVENPGSV